MPRKVVRLFLWAWKKSVLRRECGASTDLTPGTSSLSYVWSQIQGSKVTLNGPNTAKPTFKSTLPGVYKFSLTVKDGQATSAPATVTIALQDNRLLDEAANAPEKPLNA